MFDRSRFELQRFNIATSTTDITLRASFVEDLQGQIGAGSDVRVENLALVGKLEAVANGASAIIYNPSVIEELTASAVGTAAFPIEATFVDELNALSSVGADFRLVAEFTDNLQHEGAVGANITMIVALADTLNTENRIGANLDYSASVSAILSAFTDAGNLEELVTIILGSIPPGSELRIDSENFTVTLDGQNVLKMHQGDWIDMERELWGIVVNAAGSLEGNVVYKERYL